MRTTFHSIRWKNFLSTGNDWIEFQLDKNQNTLFIGKNGAGKSTILDALSFLFFNKAFRDINKPALINSITRKECVVEGEVSTGGYRYRIVRGMKPSVFEIYRNGELINQNSATRDYQDFLEKKILGMNHKSFCQVIILGNASFVPFMKLPPAGRREVIEDILDLQIYTKMNSILKTKTQDSNQRIGAVRTRIQMIEHEINVLKSYEHDSLQEAEEQILEKTRKINDLVKRWDELENEIKIKQNDKKFLSDTLQEKNRIQQELTKLNNLKVQILGAVASLRNTVTFFQNHDTCPTCTQEIPDELKDKVKTETQEKIEERDKAVQAIGKRFDEKSSKLSEFQTTEQKISDLTGDILTHKAEIKALRDQIDMLDEDIQKLMKKKDRNLVGDDLKDAIAGASAEMHDLLLEKDLLEAVGVLLKDDGVKSKVIKQYIPIINNLLNKYLAALDFFVAFELDENFKETIKSRYRDEFTYSSFSEGEKFRLNIAVLLTWRAIAQMRNSVSTNLMILDEVMDSSLDADGTEEFLKIVLKALTTDTNVIIISHKVDQLVDKFEKVVHFKKRKNFTRIEENV